MDGALAPSAAEYVSAGHRVHTDSSFPPRVSENLPEAQRLQGAVPVTALNLPAGHCAHGPPSGPDQPRLQEHDDLPAGACEFDGQA